MKTDQQTGLPGIIDTVFLFFTKPIFGLAGKFGMNLKEMERFLKFMVVGTIGFVVDYGTLNFLVLVLDFNLIFANSISFSLAVISNFTWNRYWTYPDSRTKPIRSQLIQFTFVNLMGWGINTLVLWSTTPYFTSLVGELGFNISKAIATIIVLFWNFFVNRYWTYNDVS
ncbi:MAG: GtrA family protein [Anaerolineales bacterium]|nr:GtrA family protein [Anaerolineales bacterium]